MGKKRINCIRHIILIASFLCLLAAFAYLLFHFIGQQKYRNTIKSIRDMAYFPNADETELFLTQEDASVSDGEEQGTDAHSGQAIINFRYLSKINKDVSAWLKIPGTNIDYPVLHRDHDEEYYLYRDLNQKYSGYGSLFFAQGCMPLRKDTSLLIYGHHMKDGSMFAGLMQYKQKKFYDSHPYIHLYTPEYNYQYRIASVFLTDISKDNPDAIYCDDYIDMSDPAVFEEFARLTDKRELYDTDVELYPGDQLLMLSTCEYSSQNGRLVVVACQTDQRSTH